MRFTEYFNTEDVRNISGVVVMLFVGAIAVATMWNTPMWLPVAAFSTSALFCFLIFITTEKHGLQVTLFWMEAFLILALYFLVTGETIAVLSIVWIVQGAELYGSRRASIYLLANLASFVASRVYHSGADGILDALLSSVLYGLLQVFALSVVLRGIRERQLREETAALNRELVATRELLSQTAAQSERVRIARDLHDTLGHHMTALILNLEVANHRVLDVETPKSAEMAREKVEQSLALAKLLLGDIRSAVSDLREDNAIDLQQSIDTLIGGIPNLAVTVDFSTAAPITSVAAAETLWRCTQEAITNVIRHSGATECRITLAGEGGNCVLTVSDNGSSNAEVQPGNGLKGMEERVQAIGGTLSLQPRSNGFGLRVQLPPGATG
jgi:two-component system sensor histidine kinase DesK